MVGFSSLTASLSSFTVSPVFAFVSMILSSRRFNVSPYWATISLILLNISWIFARPFVTFFIYSLLWFIRFWNYWILGSKSSLSFSSSCSWDSRSIIKPESSLVSPPSDHSSSSSSSSASSSSLLDSSNKLYFSYLASPYFFSLLNPCFL